MLTPQDWAIVHALFQSALDLEPGMREDFLKSSCSDPGVRAEVRSLLETHRDDDFLSTPALQNGRAVIETALEAQPEKSGEENFLAAQLVGLLAGERYRLDRMLARGGHGLVFLATDLRLSERRVVVKILDGAAEHQRWLQRRFQQEIEILGKISHPGVAGIRDCGEILGQPYLVMDFIEGVTLREYMKSGLPLPQIAATISQLGSALRAAHLKGVVHRDLKPENIMVQQIEQNGPGGYSVKLIDFGIAQMERAEAGGTTTVLMIAGTAKYMAPEQFLGVATPATDIYALSIVCFEMLTGQTPYIGPDPLTLAAEQRTAPEAILEKFDSIPFYTKPLIAQALAMSPKRRPPDAEAFGDAIRDSLLRPPPDWISRTRMRMFRDARSRVLAAALLVTLAALVFAIGTWVQSNSHVQMLVTASGVNDPLSEGFSTLNDIRGTAQLTADGRGIEAWSLLTAAQGFYVHPLTWQQRRAAMKRGWRLIASARADEGALYLGVDFLDLGPRFATGATLEGESLVLRAWTNQASSEWESLSAAIPGDPHAYHTYELVFDPERKTAAISVDGVERIRDYQGVRQFQDTHGVAFGNHRWKSAEARAEFRSVRFEIRN